MENNYKLMQMLMQMLLADADADAEPAHLPTPAHIDNSQSKCDDHADVFVLKCKLNIHSDLLGFSLCSRLCELQHSVGCQQS